MITEERLREIEEMPEVPGVVVMCELIDEVRRLQCDLEGAYQVGATTARNADGLKADLKECRKFCYDWSAENRALRELLSVSKAALKRIKLGILWVDNHEWFDSILDRIDAALGGGE